MIPDRNHGCDLVDDSYDLIDPVPKKVSMQIMAIMARSCTELSVWPLWSHIWFLDMVYKKGRPGHALSM